MPEPAIRLPTNTVGSLIVCAIVKRHIHVGQQRKIELLLPISFNQDDKNDKDILESTSIPDKLNYLNIRSEPGFKTLLGMRHKSWRFSVRLEAFNSDAWIGEVADFLDSV
jgi:hypothetical protein